MNRAESALQFISPVERETWVSVGMALSSEFGDAAKDLWLDWSRQADSYNDNSARNVWRSFRGAGITIATLYHEARQNGWKDEGFQQPTPDEIAARKKAEQERASKDGQERARLAREAAKKGEWILSQCKHERHAYLHKKGFQELEGLVWRPAPEENLLCIPMYVGSQLAGVQLIDKEGGKKYLSGQITAKAEYRIGNSGLGAVHWWVEGYASGLSLQECLKAIKRPYLIHVTFSAQNLKRMAHSGFVVADNDASGTGLKAAQDTKLPYWMPENVGEDINDVHRKNGVFRASQMLGKWLREMQTMRC